ncbi:PSP1 domain-containing protein [Lactococcus protaetiae]|uniref:Stage 0 sporulation family protein n=1 Tax=Lactococcus protaetiae TaxID=2592653 RepID=A0A514Z7Q6_9LACT|nr:stage 0 sporulation family protein [Lactococcus protaetiae]MCL2113657.1 stage 0 sporulation family protein [Streptococcaceae bacterium]QDK70628.1 stage 0 sporulation family protein [Lactococcus protaetiae]
MIYEVKFEHGEANAFAESNLELVAQTGVIMQSDKGLFYGKIIRKIDANVETCFDVLKEVSTEDREEIKSLEVHSLEAKTKVRELVKAQDLDMKVINVAYNFDKTQLFISFTAENRVDFRVLLKELATTFKTRIELRQIGTRDAAQLLGGIGPCGRPLCCTNFMYEFPNVSIKMAKNQNLSLKQSKLNGLCGRLMCCLTYEDKFYQEAQEFFPDFGEAVATEEGRGKVIGLNILKNRVKIRFEEYSKEFDLAEIEVNRG